MEKELMYMQTRIHTLAGTSSAKRMAKGPIATKKQEQSSLGTGKTTSLSKDSGSSPTATTSKALSAITNLMERAAGTSSTGTKSPDAISKLSFPTRTLTTRKSTLS